MKDIRVRAAVVVCCMIGFLALLGWAGDVDYTEQVILGMTQEQYDSVRAHLAHESGKEPTEREIAHWWAGHSR